MKVLFVQPPHPPNTFVSRSGLAEPLAYEILASAISHHDAKIFDMRIEHTALEDEIETYGPDLVGVGCVTAGYYECIGVLRRVKRVNPEILTVIGGHHPSVRPHDFQNDLADFIVLGEGEETFRELVDVLESKSSPVGVKGLAILNNDRLHFSGARPLIDLNDMPVPDRKMTSGYRSHYFRGTWRPIVSIIGSRGCAFRCKFCCQWQLNRGTYRVRSPEKIVEELSGIQEQFIDFIDDNSWGNTQWMEELYERIKEAKINKTYKLYARSDLLILKPDLVEKWRDIGLRAVLLGLESFRDEDLKKWNKKNTISNNVLATKILRDHEIETIGYFLIDPSYTEEDFRRLIHHVRELDIDQPIFAILTPFPGTQLYEEVKDRLLTSNYEYFDAMHALMPTTLPPHTFYRLYAQLYRKAYPKGKLIKKILQGKFAFSIPQALAQRRYLRQLGPVED